MQTDFNKISNVYFSLREFKYFVVTHPHPLRTAVIFINFKYFENLRFSLLYNNKITAVYGCVDGVPKEI